MLDDAKVIARSFQGSWAGFIVRKSNYCELRRLLRIRIFTNLGKEWPMREYQFSCGREYGFSDIWFYSLHAYIMDLYNFYYRYSEGY